MKFPDRKATDKALELLISQIANGENVGITIIYSIINESGAVSTDVTTTINAIENLELVLSVATIKTSRKIGSIIREIKDRKNSLN